MQRLQQVFETKVLDRCYNHVRYKISEYMGYDNPVNEMGETATSIVGQAVYELCVMWTLRRKPIDVQPTRSNTSFRDW